MKFPNPEFSVDTLNRREFEIPTESIDPSATKISFELNVKFQSPNLSNYNLIQKEMLHFYTQNEYERLQSITQPDFEMLLRVVENINSIPELIILLVKYIKCVARSDVEHLSDFILQDIKDTFDRLNLTNEESQSFQMSICRRFNPFQQPTDEILDRWFTKYRNNTWLGVAKSEFLHTLQGCISLEQERRASFPRAYLLEENCSVLTHALLYVPVDRLKEGLKTAVQRGVIDDVDDDLHDFIHDRVHNPME